MLLYIVVHVARPLVIINDLVTCMNRSTDCWKGNTLVCWKEQHKKLHVLTITLPSLSKISLSQINHHTTSISSFPRFKGTQRRHPRFNFFHFRAVFSKIFSNNRFSAKTQRLAPPSRISWIHHCHPLSSCGNTKNDKLTVFCVPHPN